MKSPSSFLTISLIIVLLFLLPSGVLTAAPSSVPQAGPCVPGAAYDAACDVNHDNIVNTLDIQLTAGHWGQSGTWLSDNNHNHLGQTWVGSSTPLQIQGTFGTPDFAPLILSNSATAGNGLRVASAGGNGVTVNWAGVTGIAIGNAGSDGVTVYAAGSPSVSTYSTQKNGFEVAGAQGNGLYVGRADNQGVYVYSAGESGVEVNMAAGDGVAVIAAGNDGIVVAAAGTPSSSTFSNEKNGCEVAGAQGNGVYVGRADNQGVVVNSTGGNGIGINSAGYDGVSVVAAGNDGVIVGSAGTPSTVIYSTQKTGFEVAGAQGYGLYVGRADVSGVVVSSVGNTGLYVGESPHYGVDVPGGDWAGYFWGSIYVRNGCFGCLQATFGVNAGDGPLQPGDVVSVQAVITTDFDTGNTVWQVAQAQPGQSVVGVVTGRAELVFATEHRSSETGQRLVPRKGSARPGEYVTVVYSGPMQVRVAPGAGTITAGSRLTAAADGTVRTLNRIKVQLAAGNGTADIDEDVPLIGVALETATDGLVWILVNPQ